MTRKRTLSSLLVYCDGLCEPNPGGIGTWGFVAVRDGQTVASNRGSLGRKRHMTNNVAEYAGVVEALRWVQSQGYTNVAICTDSMLVVNQVSGEWGCRKAHLWPLCAEARSLLALTRSFLEWVPRSQNTLADWQTRAAYREALEAELALLYERDDGTSALGVDEELDRALTARLEREP